MESLVCTCSKHIYLQRANVFQTSLLPEGGFLCFYLRDKIYVPIIHDVLGIPREHWFDTEHFQQKENGNDSWMP